MIAKTHMRVTIVFGQQGTKCVADLKHNEMLISDSQGKANVPNNIFQSVFTNDDGSPIPHI